MQKLTRVSNYDIWYLDNFYDDPDQVRKYALSLNYSRSNSDLFPGVRSGLTEEFYSYFLKLFNDKISLTSFDIASGFHKISILYENLNSNLNTGFIHVDLFDHFLKGKKTFAGLIYLNKKTCPTAGTSFFKMKCTTGDKIRIIDGDNFNLFNSLHDNGLHHDIFFHEYIKVYNPFLKRKYLNDFLENKEIVDSKFEKDIEVQNVYNRLVLYDSTYFHTASHFYANNFEARLTQPFFIKML